MSDISDVLVALAQQAAAALYPNGSGAASVTNSDIIIYPGWPASDNLNQDLVAGKTHVSVFPKAEERNTTRYPEKRFITKAPAPTLTLVIGLTDSGGHLQLGGGGNLLEEDGGSFLLEGISATVTVGGAVAVPQNVMLRVNGQDYVYAVQGNDTLESIASALAALVAADLTGTSAQGSVITIGSGGRVQGARVGGFGTVAREIRRQERVVMITVWAGTPELRDQIAAAIDIALASQRFITMPDGFGARVIYKNSQVVDALQKATLYRRDLNYTVEFATTITEQAAAVIAPVLTIKSGGVLGGGNLELDEGGDLLQEGGGALLLDSATSEITITI